MSFPTYLKRKSTGSNERMAADIAPAFAADALKAISSAAEALAALSKTPNPTPEQTLSAVLTWRAGQPEIARLERELLGCTILGGTASSTTAAKLSVRPQTLSAWLAGTVARWRGQEMKRVKEGEWKPLQLADQQVFSSETANSASDGAAYTPTDAPSTSATAAGAGRNTAGTASLAVGASTPNRSTEELEAEVRAQGVDVDAVIRDSIGGA